MEGTLTDCSAGQDGHKKTGECPTFSLFLSDKTFLEQINIFFIPIRIFSSSLICLYKFKTIFYVS